MNSLFPYLAWMLGLFIVIESFCAFYKMDNGDKLCRILKYSLGMAVGLVGIWFAHFDKVTWVWILAQSAIALYMWPTTYARFTGRFRNRVNDR